VSPPWDAVVVGGGPAGLAFAAAAAASGLSVLVLERETFPVDKACGEGLLPAGRRALEALGVLPLLAPGAAAELRSIRWRDEGGRGVRLALPPPFGLGIRRTALSTALRARALSLGVEVREATSVAAHARGPAGVRAVLAGGEEVEGRVLVAADGLSSPVRRREGLELPVAGARRLGVRRHFSVAPWSDGVEVHFGDGVEAYVTPVGPHEVGIAFLFAGLSPSPSASPRPATPDEVAPGSTRFDDLLQRFPALSSALRGAAPSSSVRGAGPLARRSRAPVADRLVLLGDAAGYLDAVTGEGLSLSLSCALDLARLLPAALQAGASARALAPYARLWRRRYRVYRAYTGLMLQLSTRPALRRAVLRVAGGLPAPFERAVAVAVG
jgi:2-polyprenyl-6-methoxyphenol hydroxylase-like FAD-dependent oxidoreductase